MALQFEPISLEQQDLYRERLKQSNWEASDYSFVNLWGWRKAYGLEWAWDDDLVWIRQAAPKAALWAPVGPWDQIDWPGRIARHFTGSTIFIRVPEPLIYCWRAAMGGRVAATAVEDQWDYLYSVPDLVELKGNRFHKKKNLLNQFRKKYDFAYLPLTPDMVEGRDDLNGMVGQKLTVIAWLWARTVKSPNPAFSHVDVPLVKSFVLSRKKNREAWIKPVVEGDSYRFEILLGKPPKEAQNGTKLSWGANFRCILSDTPIEPKYIKAEGVAGRMGQRLMAVVTQGRRGRIYLPPSDEMEVVAASAQPNWLPKGAVPKKLTGGTCYGYGLDEWGKLFTQRQLVGLTTFSDLVLEIREEAIAQAKAVGMVDDGTLFDQGGTGATAYGDAIAVYLAFAVNRSVDRGSTICSWDSSPKMEALRNTFSRQAIQMTWDFAEGNPFSDSSGNIVKNIDWVTKSVAAFIGKTNCACLQATASKQQMSSGKIISTDPPYYDNVGYADLSDFFYVWLRRSLKPLFLDIFATMAVPKTEELVASPYRHGGKKQAETFFLEGMTGVIQNLAAQANEAFPVTIYYAFKQDTNTASTGWETFLEAVIQSGFAITGTWPMRTELGNRMIGMGTNALASSIVLVCRKRPADASTVSRRNFQRELKIALPEALEAMIGGRDGASPIAPVDLAQAAIGPGMAVFSKYAAVLEADGSPMGVHAALVQINREIDDYFNAAEGDLDADSRFCIDWFQEYGFKAAEFGRADVLARAKGTSVDAVAAAGGVPVLADDWHIDLCLGGAQKCLSAPPDTCFLSVSAKAWEIIEAVNYVGYDALKPFHRAVKNRFFPYTPNWQGVAALHAAAELLLDEGLENSYNRHDVVARMCRRRLIEMGLQLFPAADAIPSPTVTAASIPEGFTWETWDRRLRQSGLVVAGSYGPLAEKVFRLGHMGTQADMDWMEKALNVIAEAL